jgi:hypothetical protein
MEYYIGQMWYHLWSVYGGRFFCFVNESEATRGFPIRFVTNTAAC